MSDPSSFVAALREVDQAQQAERLRPGAVHRISRRLDAELLQAELPGRRRTFIPMISFAAGAAMVLAVFTLDSSPDEAVLEAKGPAPMHASWQVGGDNCHASKGETEVIFDGRCRVVVPESSLVFESRKTTRFSAVDHGVALLEGAAMFEVGPAAATDNPVRRVEVPGGAIEVMGTRFSVVVYDDRGHVDLLEGSIRFVDLDGNVHEIAPGERFHFSAHRDSPVTTVAAVTETPPAEAPLTAPEPAPPLAAGELLAALAAEPDESSHARPSASKSRAASVEKLRHIVEKVAELRAQRQYRAAVSLLQGVLDQRWDRRTREVLSYELGTILSTQLPDRAKACAHWAAHRERFSAGRYDRAIERAEERLACDR